MSSGNEYVRVSDLPGFTPRVATAKRMAEILELRHKVVAGTTIVVQTPDIHEEGAFLAMLEDEIDLAGLSEALQTPTVEMPFFETAEDLVRWAEAEVIEKKKFDCGGYMGFDCGDAGCRTCNS